MIVSKIRKLNKKNSTSQSSTFFKEREIKRLVIGLNFMINANTMRQAILDKDRDMFQSLLIKIVQPRSSELIPPLLKGLGSFITNLEIDLNNKASISTNQKALM